MDVLYPELEEVDGCIYRINVTDNYSIGLNAENLPYVEYEEDQDEIGTIMETLHSDEEDDEENEIIAENGNYMIEFHVAKMYISRIIGYKGSTIQRLRSETNTQIKPPQKNEDGDIVIIGKRRDNVASAYRRIKIMVNTFRQKEQFTHFLSIPMNNNQLQEKLEHFKRNVLEIFGQDRGISEEIFQLPGKLHLTVALFVLADDVERKKAVNALKKCCNLFSDLITNNKPAKIRVQGVTCMNDDPSEVHVLYGKIIIDDRVQQFIDNVFNTLSKEDTVIKTERGLKLHLTLMNTAFSKAYKEGVEMEKKHKFRDSFDARNILQNFDDFDFGEVELDTLHLSQRHTVGEDGYYIPSYKITLS